MNRAELESSPKLDPRKCLDQNPTGEDQGKGQLWLTPARSQKTEDNHRKMLGVIDDTIPKGHLDGINSAEKNQTHFYPLQVLMKGWRDCSESASDGIKEIEG